jgi:hypothetical protein
MPLYLWCDLLLIASLLSDSAVEWLASWVELCRAVSRKFCIRTYIYLIMHLPPTSSSATSSSGAWRMST